MVRVDALHGAVVIGILRRRRVTADRVFLDIAVM